VEGIAVILVDGGGRAYLPASTLPPGIGAGSIVDVTLTPVTPSAGAEAAEEIAALIERLRAGEHRGGQDHD
jgi:hypothetical protein